MCIRDRLFPFYSSHGEARSEYLEAVKKGRGYWLQNKSQWLLIEKIDEDDGWRINNLLISRELGWETAFLFLEKAARQQFKRALYINLEANIILQQWLAAKGYQLEAGVWKKVLVYHTGLVLGGGGARGAYQIGVWKALLEKDIQFEVITGTSVGGLNGALIAQGDYNQALALWEEIETDKVLDITFKEVEVLDFSAQVDQLRTFIRTSLQQRGVSSEPLRSLLEERLEAQKIHSGCPFYVLPALPPVVRGLPARPSARAEKLSPASTTRIQLQWLHSRRKLYNICTNNLPAIVTTTPFSLVKSNRPRRPG